MEKKYLYLNISKSCNDDEDTIPPIICTELSVLTDINHTIYRNALFHYKIFQFESPEYTDKFCVKPSSYIPKAVRKCGIQRRHLKYACVNTYKLWTLGLLIQEFGSHFYYHRGQPLTITRLLSRVTLHSIVDDTLSARLDILKRPLSLLEVYAFMKYTLVNCLLFDNCRAIHYHMSNYSEKIAIFRFNNPFDLNYCGSYENIYTLINEPLQQQCRPQIDCL